MDLNQLITDRFNVLIENGKVQEAIDAQLITLVNSTVKDLTQSYSDFGRQLKTKLSEVFKVNLDSLDIPTYNSIVMKVIASNLDTTLFAAVREPITEELKSCIGLLDKPEYTISEIIEEFKKSIMEDHGNDNEGEISFHVSEQYSSRYFYFDEKPDKSPSQCAYRLWSNINDGKVWYIQAKDRSSSKDLTKNPLMGHFERFMFKLFTNKTIIKNDSHNVEPYWTRYND